MALDNEHTIETYRSLITISIEALKTLLLINGGAVVAILAFLGQAPQGPKLAQFIAWPLGLFCAGVFCGGAAFMGSYLTQLALYNEWLVQDNSQTLNHKWFLWATFLLVIGSLVCFALGAFTSIDMFANHIVA